MEEMGGIHLSTSHPNPPLPSKPLLPHSSPFLQYSLIAPLPTFPPHFNLHAAVEFSLPFFFNLFPSSKLLLQGTLVNVSAILRSLCPPAGAQRAMQMQRITLTKLQVLNNVLKNK